MQDNLNSIIEDDRQHKDFSDEYYSIEQVAKKLGVDEPTVIFWCNKFNDLLEIQSLGMYHIFNSIDIDNLRIIKELNIDKELSIKETREQIERNKTKVIEKKEKQLSQMDMIDILANVIKSKLPELSVLNTISQIMQVQNERIESLTNDSKQIKAFCNTILEENKSLKENLGGKIDTQLEKIQETVVGELAELKIGIDNSEKDSLERDKNLLGNIKNKLEEQKELYLIEISNKGKKKPLWSRFFK